MHNSLVNNYCQVFYYAKVQMIKGLFLPIKHNVRVTLWHLQLFASIFLYINRLFFFFFVCFPVRFFPLCFFWDSYYYVFAQRAGVSIFLHREHTQRMDEVDGRGAMTAPPNNASSPEVFGGWNKQMHPQKQHARPRTRYKADREIERDRETLLC